MHVEFTGRQVVITRKHRSMFQPCLERLEQILPKEGTIHVVLTAEKYRHIAEITAKTQIGAIVALCEETTMDEALRGACEKAEKQAIRLMSRLRAQRRKPKEDKQTEAVPVNGSRRSRTAAEPESHAAVVKKASSNGKAAKVTVPVVIHGFPKTKAVHEPHIVRSLDAVALRPMTLDEAVKEAQFRDREVFVFRDHRGSLMVLHRKRDGKMELIETPLG